MKRATIALLFVCLCGYLVSRAASGEKESPVLVMRLSSPKTSVKVGQYPELSITITNKGEHPVTLVRPGDGSQNGWRTPIVNVSFIKIGSKAKHPAEAVPQTLGRCGNINPLKAKEVFDVAPGETKELTKWYPRQPFSDSGRYSVVFLYANRPTLAWKGEPLGQHDAGAMRRVKNSTECSLKSNQVLFTVRK